MGAKINRVIVDDDNNVLGRLTAPGFGRQGWFVNPKLGGKGEAGKLGMGFAKNIAEGGSFLRKIAAAQTGLPAHTPNIGAALADFEYVNTPWRAGDPGHVIRKPHEEDSQ